VRFALRCPRCADVSVPPRDLELFLAPDSTEAEMVFDCPSCDAAVRARCDQPMARLLTLSGARVHRPREDELTAFRELLATDGWFDRLLAGPPGPAEAS
jgi:hypothetical protein